MPITRRTGPRRPRSPLPLVLLGLMATAGWGGACTLGALEGRGGAQEPSPVEDTAASLLPDPNAPEPPPLEWQPPPLAEWPDHYVIFNNMPCGHDCTLEDQRALAPRSVMRKMIIEAIHAVKEGGVIRVSNFNISSSSSVRPVIEALQWAMTERHATVQVVMDSAQNSQGSKSWDLAQNGVEVRFLQGLTYTSPSEPDVPKVGIEHSKMLIVDDQVVLTGSNNFSSTGFATNEENSVVLRAPLHADRILAFTCDFDRMFEAGVKAGEPQRPDDDPTRRAAIEGLASCNQEGVVWFPPSGALEGSSPTYGAISRGIRFSRQTIDMAPDMLAHPGLIGAIVRNARYLQQFESTLEVRVLLDGSGEAMNNPAFGECLRDAATTWGFKFQVRYWPGTEDIFQLLHHKFMLVDAADPERGALYNGSANFSAKALKWSFENVALYRANGGFADTVRLFAARFERLWEQGLDAQQMRDQEDVEVPACPMSIETIVDGAAPAAGG